jgi:hypothetical protein
MNHQVIHDYKYFITANYIYDEINEFIKDHNVQYAYIIGFSIKNIRKGPYTVSERIINGFKQSTADDIHHFFREKNEKLFFTSDEGYFFVLVKTNVLCTKNLKLSYFNNYQTERPKKDLISKFQDLIFSPFLYQGIQIKAETNLMVGIYGVHSNDIFYLIQSLQTMIE